MLAPLHRSPFTRKLNVVCPDSNRGDLAGLLAYSPLSTFPSRLLEQWYEDSAVVNCQSSVVSFSHDSRLTIHAKNLQLRG
jgi:hypothetical protein